MKTKEELNALKEEVETLNKKLVELTDDELEQVGGGIAGYYQVQAHIYNQAGSLNPIFLDYSIYSKTDSSDIYDCVGYEDNNDGSTSWIFVSRKGKNNLLFVARPNQYIITDYWG